MKKTLAFLLLFSLILGSSIIAFAAEPTKTEDDFDPSEYTDEALLEIRNEIIAELASRSQSNRSNEESIGNTLDGWEFDSTYVSNDYYDIVETARFTNSIGYTMLVHKVLAKQDVSLSSTIIATATDGTIIEKEEDDIVLTEGQYNYFLYSFENDISNAKMTSQVKAKKDSFMLGARNAVEMVSYNQSGDDLYITFMQVEDDIGAFAKFKILFYKADKIVDVEDGFFTTSTENLAGKGTTDIASIWVYGTKFDRIEYIFEP